MKPGQQSVCVPSVNYLLSKGKALEASLREKRMVNTGTQCGKQALSSTGSNHQRRPRRSLSDVGVTGSTYWHICLLNISTDSLCLCTHVTNGMTHRMLLHKSFCQVALQIQSQKAAYNTFFLKICYLSFIWAGKPLFQDNSGQDRSIKSDRCRNHVGFMEGRMDSRCMSFDLR